MSPDREMAIEAMRNMGWTAQRTGTGKQVTWEFKRPDTGGLWDVVRRKQTLLSMNWVADVAIQYGDAPDLWADISAIRQAWLAKRFAGIFAAARNEGAQ